MVANFLFNQEVNFTYKHECDSSYIDHVLIPEYVADMVKECKILSNHIDNTSDQFAVHLSIDLPYVMLTDNKALKQNIYSIPRPNWNDINFQLSYGRELGKALFLMNIEACDINTYNYLHFDKSYYLMDVAQFICQIFILSQIQSKHI